MSYAPQIELTADGSATLRNPVHGDTYHSLRGAMGEARHVFIEAGFAAANANAIPNFGEAMGFKILEIGFGTGLNAFLTLEEAEKTGVRVEYTGVELYPVPEDVAARLNYTADSRFMALHRTAWGVATEITPTKIAHGFRLEKLRVDLTRDLAEIALRGPFDLIYFDAFAPDTQPEMWTVEVFRRIFDAMSDGGILVTYCSKGDVRRAMQAAGFAVEKLQGALGKRHMLRAQKLTDRANA